MTTFVFYLVEQALPMANGFPQPDRREVHCCALHVWESILADEESGQIPDRQTVREICRFDGEVSDTLNEWEFVIRHEAERYESFNLRTANNCIGLFIGDEAVRAAQLASA